MTEFDPFEMCRILNEEKVEYVVLGGFAAVLRGSPVTTRDLDVIPDRNPENLDRLGRALNRMKRADRTQQGPLTLPRPCQTWTQPPCVRSCFRETWAARRSCSCLSWWTARD
jgi:hypothetical protein